MSDQSSPAELPAIEVRPVASVEPLPRIEGLPQMVPLPDLARALSVTAAHLRELLCAEPAPRIFRLSRCVTVVDLDWFRGWLEARRVKSRAEEDRVVELTRTVAGIRRPNPFGRQVCGPEETSPRSNQSAAESRQRKKR